MVKRLAPPGLGGAKGENRTMPANSDSGAARSWRIAVYAAQFFFGGWFAFHGLNHWMEFFPQPPGAASVSSQLIRALIASGLFDWVKAVEVAAGIALLCNRFVPTAAVASLPISFVIGYLNIAVENDANALFVFFGVIGLNLLIMVGHFDRILPMLAPGNHAPNLAGLCRLLPISDANYSDAMRAPGGAFGEGRAAPLRLPLHLAGIALGIALPVYLTLSTLPEPGEAGSAQPPAVQSGNRQDRP